MSRRSCARSAFLLSLILNVSSLLAVAEPTIGNASLSAVLNSAGDAWGTVGAHENVLTWDPETNAREYAVSRSTGTQSAFFELFRTPLTNGVDFIRVDETTTYCYRIEALDDSGNRIRRYSPVCVSRNAILKMEAEEFAEPELVGCPPPYATINSMCLSDEEFVASTLSEAEIRSLLSPPSHDSFLQRNIADVDGVIINPAHVIFKAAQASAINARVLLATLEKESSAISLTSRPNNIRLQTLMGYNPDICKLPKSSCTVREQIADAAAQFRRDINRLSAGRPAPGGNPPWQVGVTTSSEDPLPVTPEKKAVATLFSYTDWVGERWCGAKGVGGNSLFCEVWTNFGFASPPPASLNVSLVATPSSGSVPLRGVTLSAAISGSAQGSINYTFYCNRSDVETDIRPGFDAKFDHTSKNPKIVSNLCTYRSAGTYTAKVIAERGSGVAESRVKITVGNPTTCYFLLLARNDPSGGIVPTALPSNSPGCVVGQYTAGQLIQVTAAPANGRRVENWIGTQNDASTSVTNTVVMPASSHSVTVNYVQASTSGAPSVTGRTADGITASTATLHASVNPNGLSTNVAFEIGTGTATSFVSTPSQNIGSGQGFVPFSWNLADLNCGTTYTYYATATNTAGTTSGPQNTFATSPCGPTLMIVTASLPDGAASQPYSAQLTASGGTGSGYVWSLDNGSLPTGLTLNAQTGLISGIPAIGSQTSNFSIRVRDSGGHFTTRGLSIFVHQMLSIDSNAPSNFVFSVGVPYTSANSITYLALGGQAPFSWQATGLPPGLQIDPVTSLLFGTPTQPGNFPAQITVSDSLGQTASLATLLRVITTTIIITDSSGHTPPNPPAGTVGVSYQFFFAAQGGSQSGYVWSVPQGTLPPGLVAGKPPGCSSSTCALLISGTPTQGGTFSFTVTVIDSLGDTGSQGATIVINTGTPPAIQTFKLPIATIGSAYSTPIAANGGTPTYQWSFVGPSPDPGIQLSPSGVLSGTPTLTNDCPTGASNGPAIWVGPNYPTTYFSVKVTDAAGQSATTTLCLVSYYPLPQLTDANPPSVIVDGQNHTIAVHGSNLRSTSMLEIGSNAPSPTTYVSPTEVIFNLYPAFAGFATSPGGASYGEGPYAIQVVQPYASFSTSSVNFSIFDPPPTVSAVSAVLNNTSQPCKANLSCQLVVSGTGFVFSTSFVVIEGNQDVGRVDHTPAAVPWTQVTTGAFSVPTAGTYTLRVTNGSQPNGQPANVVVPFTVQP